VRGVLQAVEGRSALALPQRCKIVADVNRWVVWNFDVFGGHVLTNAATEALPPTLALAALEGCYFLFSVRKCIEMSLMF
jgi:hypothetical protein